MKDSLPGINRFHSNVGPSGVTKTLKSLLTRKSFLALAVILTVAIGADTTIAQEDNAISGASVFPESTVVYVEIREPKDLVSEILEHPLIADIKDLELVKQAIDEDQLQYLPIVFGLIKGKTGMEWDALLKEITRKGVYLCVDEATGGSALLIHSGSAEKLKEITGMALGMAKTDAVNNGREPPYTIETYRGHKVAKFEGGILARIDDWLLLSNKPKLAKTIADNLLDGNTNTFASSAEVQRLQEENAGQDIWAYVNLETVREKNLAENVFRGKTDNAGIELVIGGILEALNTSSQLVIGAELTEGEFAVHAEMPFDSSLAKKSREFFFGPDGNALAPKRLAVTDTLADIVAYRDISSWWNSKEELFDENVIAQLAQADSQLSTLFAGLDFGEDVLGQLEPGIQIIAKPQAYQEDYQPDVKVPSFAVIGRLKDPAIQRRLRISYNSFVGFINIQLGMQGQPQLETTSEKLDGGHVVSAQYLLDDESPDGLIHYNFSPSIAFKDEYFIISSTKDLAKELVASAAAMDTTSTESVHSGIWLEGEQLADALKLNREALIVQNMIEDGNDRDSAEVTIDSLLELLEFIEDAELEFKNEDKHLKLDMKINFKRQ